MPWGKGQPFSLSQNRVWAALGGVPGGRGIVPRGTFKVEWNGAYPGLLEVNCFVGVAVAGNYGVLCLVTANGDLAVFHTDWSGKVKESRSSFVHGRS
jgi:hypothetical protein